MKFFLIAAMSIAAVPFKNCNNSTVVNCYEGRLEIKGPCSNYTVRILRGNIQSSAIMAHWTNEATKQTYKDVFAVGNPCNFPSNINEGDHFSFVVDTTLHEDCMTCKIYSPKPSRALKIRVLPEPYKHKL